MQDLNSVYIPQQDKLSAITQVVPANAVISCPECHSQKCKKNGLEHRQYGRVQRYKCNHCGYSFTNSGIYKREKYKDNSISAEELGIQQNPSYRSVSVSLNKIYQPWLLEYVKKFIRFLASRNEFGTIVNQISYLNKFSRFVLDKHPDLKIEDLDREIVIEYLASLRNLNKAGVYIGTLRLFLDTGIANSWFKVPPYLITNEDYPKRFRPLPRYIPEIVMQQLNKYLDDLPKPVMRMVLVMQECGFRISELTTLRLNCLDKTSSSEYFVKYNNWKLKKEEAKPISLELAQVILEQQKYIIEQGFSDFNYLFCGQEHHQKGRFGFSGDYIPKPNTMRKEKFTRFLKALAEKHRIVDYNGKIWNFQSHQFRHTVGTRMINAGVPQHIVQKYLGHESPEMTMRYAHIHDHTLRKEIEEYHETRVTNFQGETITLEETILSADNDLEWFTKNIQARALEHGYCGRPKLLGNCDIPGFDGCYNCPHWRTNHNFLPILKDTLNRTAKVIEKARNCGWELQVNKNEPIQHNLAKVIASLEADNHE